VTTLDELEASELARFGPIIGKLAAALRSVTGYLKTYVALFAEAEGFAHVHLHVVPRMPDFTQEQRGPPSLSAFLGEGKSLPVGEMDRIALAIREKLARLRT
jgi:diadenosine tetraphosphate (Ap4A) HIT family hydrolase